MADQTFAVNCGFFDAIDSDRTYSADEMNRPYRRIISNGVFATPQGDPSTDLQVVESTGMNIICKTGEGLFADKWFENPSSIVITVPNNTATVPRIDSVLVQVDTRTSGRVGNIVHRTGTPASSPVPPAINQTEGVVEYRLANIRVNAGVTSIQGRYITDRRGSSDCPWVTSLIYQVDTSTLYDQWQAAYAEYFEEEKAIWDAWYAQLTEDLDVSMTLDRHTNTVTTTPQTTGYIPIGLDYNRNTDILEVYINGLRAVEGTHYVVVDDTKILVENQLQIGQEVTFVVMRSVISGSATNIMVLLQELESQIAGVAGGTPTVVDSASDMTDTEKIYILSSDSKWYYYSATAEDWVIGGTYGGVPTDTTLSISGSAADAKAVGDAIAEKANADDVDVLDTELTKAKQDLQAIATGTAQIDMGFVQGIRYPATPSTVDTSSTRCASQGAIHVGAKDVIEVTIPSGLKVGVVTTLGTNSGWKTSTYTFTATSACDVYLNVAKTSDGGVTPSEVTGVIINYTDNSSRVSILEQEDEWLTDAVNSLGVTNPIESPGYINGSGGISEQSSTRLEVYTNKIPVSIGDKITIKLRYTASHELWIAYALYKADESYITRVTLVNGTSASYYEETVTVTNANARYIAFSYRTYGDVVATVIKENTTAEKLGSPFATIIPADSYTYPTIDTTAKTLTIQNGTIIIDRRLPSGYVAISPNQICDYSSVSSTAILFTWDIANSAIVAFAYNAVVDLTNYIPLCSLRTSKGLVGSTIPIMVDGQLYGKVNLDYINQGSLWKNDNVRGVNHRGYATVAPENTLPAFKLSKDMGFSYVETDIRFTSDGVPVLLHDASINRTARNSDGTEISGTINIADITYAEASAYDYGIWKGTAYAGTPIPTFAQFLKACRRLGLRPYIELKAGTQAQIEGLVDTVISCGFKGLCTWISYSDTYLSYVKNHASGERLGLIADTYSSALITTINGLKTEDNEVILDMTVLSQIDNTVVAALIAADIALECFVNGNYSIVGANPYITGITTDSGNIGQYMYTLWNHNIYT